ncbi:MAG: exodeoxyribonuclease VII large subunit [Lachnospiraceae bacterium]|nr:exodeoxyribonuclease VII large subunit [Lachnospiraceae bacterium]
MKKVVYTVSQINRYIRGMFSQDILLSSVRIRGEVSNCKYHGSGHIYFSLKDADGSIACIMFAGKRSGLAFRMKDGDKVVCSGSVEVFERDGRYQLYASSIQREGEGELYERVLRLKRELAEMGLFDERYKQPIPQYATRIGVVTAPTGAAIRDIENIAKRRNPYVTILLYPALVQGEGAKESIVRGIRALDREGLDVIIIGRGGGSIEDLMAFNEEEVARAIFEADTPIISAVGHETDSTIADYAADLRAPTPSAAAELAVFDYSAFQRKCLQYRERLFREERRRIEEAKNRSAIIRTSLKARSPEAGIILKRKLLAEKRELLRKRMLRRTEQQTLRLQSDRGKMERILKERLYARKLRLHEIIGKLSGLNPMQRLSQGFSFVTDERGKAVRSVQSVSPGELLTIYVTDGRIRAEAREVEKDE